MATNKAIQSLLKQHADTISLGNVPTLERLSTGLPNIDWVLGGGLCKGRITMIHGSSSSGKSTFALQCIKHAQSLGLTSAFIDMEKAMDEERLLSLGINIDNTFLFCRPHSGDEALQMIDDMAEAGIDLIVLDSVPACMPKANMLMDADEFVDKITIGAQARMFANWLPRLVSKLSRNNTTALFINQERTAISTGYGHINPISLPGGKAMLFYSSIVMKIQKVGDDKKIKGNVNVKYTTTKNKTAINGRVGNILNTATGIDTDAAAQEVLINPDFELFCKDGGNFTFHPDLISSGVLDKFGFNYNERFCFGLDATVAKINADPALKSVLLKYISTNKFNAHIESLTLKPDQIETFAE